MRQERRQSQILEIAQRNWWWFCRRMYEATRFPQVPPQGERKKTLYPAPIRDLSHLPLGGINSPAPRGCIAWVQMEFCKSSGEALSSGEQRVAHGPRGMARSRLQPREDLPRLQRQREPELRPQGCRSFARATRTAGKASLWCLICADMYTESSAFCSSKWVIFWFNLYPLDLCLQGVHW